MGWQVRCKVARADSAYNALVLSTALGQSNSGPSPVLREELDAGLFESLLNGLPYLV